MGRVAENDEESDFFNGANGTSMGLNGAQIKI